MTIAKPNNLAVVLSKASSSLKGCILLFGLSFAAAEFITFAWLAGLTTKLFMLLPLLFLLGAGVGAISWVLVFEPLHQRISMAKALVSQRGAAQQAVPADVARPAGERRD